MTIRMARRTTTSHVFTIIVSLVLAASCKSVIDRQDVRPKVLRDVPSQNLAYRLTPDTNAPSDPNADELLEKLGTVATDFTTRRKDEALLRTVQSPDGQRVLAVYAAADEPSSAFHIDLYSSDGKFLRNIIPPTISCVFPETVQWSPDGNYINFVAHKAATPSPTPTPTPDSAVAPAPDLAPVPSPSIGPTFLPVESFNTEQIYICDRDGNDLKPLTRREGLIYFYFVWAPDGHALAALACKEDEWNERERQFKLPAGRPRLLMTDGSERLLDDALTDALPVWSPDSSKVATAFDTDIAIYDSAAKTPTQARIKLGDQLLTASTAYDQALAAKKTSQPTPSTSPQKAPTPAPPTPSAPASFNPIVRLQWPSPERLYFQTAFVRLMPGEAINTFQRWHSLSLSAQAAVLK